VTVTVFHVLKLIRDNWKELLIIVCLLVVVGKLHYDYRQLEDAYSTTQKSLQNQIAGLQEIHKEELALREAALQEYEVRLGEIEVRYKVSQEELQAIKSSKEKEYVRQYTGDPEMLIENIETVFGFKYVE